MNVYGLACAATYGGAQIPDTNLFLVNRSFRFELNTIYLFGTSEFKLEVLSATGSGAVTYSANTTAYFPYYSMLTTKLTTSGKLTKLTQSATVGATTAHLNYRICRNLLGVPI